MSATTRQRAISADRGDDLRVGARADDDVDALGNRSRRQRRQAHHADVFRRYIGELAAHDVVEMMVRFRVGVIHDFRRVDDQLADQLLLEEKLKRIVNGRFRSFRVARVDERQDLIRGEMFPPRE